MRQRQIVDSNQARAHSIFWRIRVLFFLAIAGALGGVFLYVGIIAWRYPPGAGDLGALEIMRRYCSGALLHFLPTALLERFPDMQHSAEFWRALHDGEQPFFVSGVEHAAFFSGVGFVAGGALFLWRRWIFSGDD